MSGPPGLHDDLRARLSFLSVCAFALAVVLNVLAATLFAGLGMGLLIVSFGGRARAALSGAVSAPATLPPGETRLTAARLTAAVISLALVAALVPGALNGSPANWATVAVPGLVILFAIAELTRASTRRHPLVTGATVVTVGLVAGIWLIHATRGMGIDVVQLHEQAAAALVHGQSPYGAAVSVPNGSPDALPGSRIVGYPYPPIAALVYASSTWLGGDPRWANLVSWIALALCGLELFRRRRGEPGAALSFLLLAALPGLSMMLQSGWTEMLSAALIALAAVTWGRPAASGIALGAALGSKQYLVVALPLIVLHRGIGWRRRAAAASATALCSVLPAFAWSPRDAWRSLVYFHARTPPRTDSSNLVGVLGLAGIHWSPPVWLSLGVSLTLVSLLARRAEGQARFWRALAAGLAAFFLLSSQAMPNYWYLVAVVGVFGAQVAIRPDGASDRFPAVR